MILVHLPGEEFTPCGIRILKPEPGTFHTQACFDGRETCFGMHVYAVPWSINPHVVNCPDCIEKVRET